MPIPSQRSLNRPAKQVKNTATPRPTRNRSRWAVFFVAWVLLSLMAGVWSVATPISGAPDEPSHIIKAASVVEGQFIGAQTEGGQSVTVPAYIAFTPAQTCFAYNDKVTANCSPVQRGDTGALVPSTTSAGLYNPTYYVLVGWPSLLFHNDTGIYAMRFISGLVSSLFLAAALMMISTWKRRTLPVVGFAVAVTPMMIFLNGVINPNSLEATATLAAFVGVLSIVLHPRKSLVAERSVIVLVSAAIAVNARGLSPLWVGIAVLIPFVLAPMPQIRELLRLTAVRIAIVGVALATAAALVWTVLSNSLGAGLTGPSTTVTGLGVGASPIRGFVQILVGTFDYGQGLIGVFGWLDSPAPSAVFFIWSLFIGGLLLAALVFLRGRPLAFVLSLAGGLILLPPITQAIYVTGGGIVWQGRYALAIYVCLVVGIAALLADRMSTLTRLARRRFVIIVIALWFTGQLYAFVTTLKRYTVGASGAEGASWPRVFLDPAWNPPGGSLLVTLVCTAVFSAGAVLVLRLALSGDESPTGSVEEKEAAV